MPTFNPTGTGYAGTEQSFTVPTTGPYKLIAKGARGGVALYADGSAFNIGGNGARLETILNLTAGHVIRIRVGHPGGDNYSSTRGAGGGGATTIYNSTTAELLLCAGGGGGAGQYAATAGETTASLTTSGKPGYLNGNSSNSAATGGNGGPGATYAGGGGGWNGAGASATSGSTYGVGGTALRLGNSYGGRGYNDGNDPTPMDGGYGGGGGGYAGCGGGGGYSGGGGGGWSYSGNGGGGGSYIHPSGTSNVMVADSTDKGSASIELNNAKPYARFSAPNQFAIDPRVAQAFTWEYNDAEGDVQTHYEIRYSLRDQNNWTSTGKIASSAESHTFAANTFTLGADYDWQIRLSNAMGDGDWSLSAYFTAGADMWKYTATTTSATTSGAVPGTTPLLFHDFNTSAPNWESNSVFGTFAAATVARTTTRPKEGTHSMEVTWPTGKSWANTICGQQVVQGGLYVISADIYVPSGSADVYLDTVFNPVRLPRNVVQQRDQWVSVSQIFMALQTDIYMGVIADSPTAGQKVFIDNFKVSPMPMPTEPGTYIAQVKTADSSGLWSPWSATTDFVVSPASNTYAKVGGVVKKIRNYFDSGIVNETGLKILAPPRMVTGLVNWLNADELKAVQGNNTRVAGWTDKVSGQVAAPRSGIHNQPLLVHDAINGHAAVRFDASNYEGLRMPITNLTAHTTFVVARWTQAGSYNGRIISGDADAGYNVLFGWHDVGAGVMYANGWVVQSPNEGKHANWRQFTFTGTGAISSMYSKGTLLASNGNGIASLGGLLVLSGYNPNGTGEMSNCEISEFIMYNRVLTAQERSQIEAYLIEKYGIV